MIVGTAGHIDHGKTALVRALTGVETDRLKEEKARGITIELGFAYLAEAGRSIGFVDVPGHERFVHTMLAGASGIDFALLVVAADDGPMPQTLEHLVILDLLGLRRGMVALSKADLADPARRDAVTAEIRALLAPTGLAGAEILPVSTVTGEGLDRLRDMLWQAAADTASRGEAGAFRLAVDRSFILAGTGTVVTGTVLSGAAAVGDTVVVSPAGLPARIRSIHAQNRPAERGVAGQRCALNLTGEGISRDAVSRGDMILDPALHAPTTRIDAQLRLLGSEPKPVGNLLTARLHHASAEVGVRLVPLEGAIPPGGQGRVQLMPERPIAAAVGDRFILRDASAQRTIGGGRFLDLRGPTRRRRTTERLEQLDAAAQTEPAEALRRLLALPPFHVELSDFVRDRALSAAEGEALAALPGLTGIRAGDLHVLMAQDRWQAFRASLLAELARFHEENPDLQGTGRERLRMLLQPRLPVPVFRAVLEEEARAGRLVLEGAFLRLPGHEVRLGTEDEDLFARIAPLIGGPHRFRPPRVRDLVPMVGAEEAQIRRLMKLCTRLGRVDQIAHDHFFLRATTAEMVEIAHDIAARTPDGTITAAAFRDRMDNGRKVAIQILDFLDRHGVTLRRGDLRRINPHRNDLFRTYAGEAPPAGSMNGPAFPPGTESEMNSPP
ncbi:selenocysteine-specific translation elongation factor [Roseomonas gilardii]|uniref:selenocysteine-specific translation elongation factor n=1 Tax=Roseomonas gilardii TaxID=257708 RepID=UPI00119CFA28|nr:selenocysteine-specific translation elongation factor [Roseomonas gilardii]